MLERRVTVKRFYCFVALIAAAALVAGCGGSSNKSSSATTTNASGTTSQPTGTPANNGKVGGKIVIDNESGSTWACPFKPFYPALQLTSFPLLYQPPQFVDILHSTKTP